VHHAAVRREEESRGQRTEERGQRAEGGKAETLKAESRNETTDHGLQDYEGKGENGRVGDEESREQKAESRNGLQDYGGKAVEGPRTTGLRDHERREPEDRGQRREDRGKAFPIVLLKRILDATLEQQAAMERFFEGQPLESAECGVRS
jgi:hypothetical protein